ncbi:unnamed protein product, partial [Rotaria socialis]
AVWQLAISGQKLLSCSSDGSVRLWDSNLSQSLQSTFTSELFSSMKQWFSKNNFNRRWHSIVYRLDNARYKSICCHV